MVTILRGADGSAAVIEELPEPVSHWTSTIQFELYGRVQEFTVGVFGLGDSVAASFGVSHWSHRLSMSGGEVRLGRHISRSARDGIVDDLTLASWAGRNFGLVTHMYNSEPGVLLDLLSWFTFDELSDGVVIRPSVDAVKLRGVKISQEFDRLGLLDVQPLTSDLATRLPSWQGTRVRGGELFQDVLSNGYPYFVLVGDVSQTLVVPPRDDISGALSSESLAILSRLRVSWRTGE